MKPCGYYVLVKIAPVNMKSKGGIIIGTETEKKREEGGRDIGRVVAVGPQAYKDVVQGCNSHQEWGFEVGSLVEFNRYDGKIPRIAEIDEKYKDYRIIIDKNIIGNADDLSEYFLDE